MAPAPQDTLQLPPVPQLIGGRWEVVAPLAQGGMGQLYVARHVQTGKMAAVKVLDRDGPEAHSRFKLEAGVAATLNHPGIVDVYDADVDRDTGRCFLAMELLEGRTLRQLLDDEAQTPASLLRLLLLTLEPLSAAHKKGYVHRDLKPENIFVIGEGEGASIKLLDFGIAGHELRRGLTRTGTAMGTPHYMSPEQAMNAAEAMPSADVWSMGVLLYEAISGRVPFMGQTAHAVVVRACTEEPPDLCAIVTGVDPQLGALVMRCLSKAPGDRPRDAGALKEELLRLHHPNSIPAQRCPSRRALSPAGEAEGASQPLELAPGVLPARGAWIASVSGTLIMLMALSARACGTIGSTPLLALGVVGALLAAAGALALPRVRRRQEEIIRVPAAVMDQAAEKVRASIRSPPTRGPDRAPVTIEVFADLGVLANRRLCQRVLAIQTAHPGDTRVALQIVPADGERLGWTLAETAEEIRQRLGEAALWSFIETTLAHARKLSESALFALSEGVGLHGVDLHRALRTSFHRLAVHARRNETRARGISADPTVIINGTVEGDLSREGLQWAVQDALRAIQHGQLGSAAALKTQLALPAGTPTHMVLRRILVCFDGARHAPKTVRRTREQARMRAEKLRARACLPGTDFADLAMRFGDGHMDLGRVELAALPDTLLSGVASLDVGDVSQPLESTDGFHLLQRLG